MKQQGHQVWAPRWPCWVKVRTALGNCVTWQCSWVRTDPKDGAPSAGICFVLDLENFAPSWHGEGTVDDFSKVCCFTKSTWWSYHFNLLHKLLPCLRGIPPVDIFLTGWDQKAWNLSDLPMFLQKQPVPTASRLIWSHGLQLEQFEHGLRTKHIQIYPIYSNIFQYCHIILFIVLSLSTIILINPPWENPKKLSLFSATWWVSGIHPGWWIVRTIYGKARCEHSSFLG